MKISVHNGVVSISLYQHIRSSPAVIPHRLYHCSLEITQYVTVISFIMLLFFRNILSILGVFILHVVGGGRKLHERWQAVKLLPLHRCQKVYNKTQWVGTGQFATAQQVVHGNSMVVLVSLARSQRQQNAPR